VSRKGVNLLTGRTRDRYPTVTLDKDVLTLARERMAVAFDRFDEVAVSFSGGKDSTVALHVSLDEARRRGQRLRVFFFDEEAIPYETEAYVRRIAAEPDIDLEWYTFPVKHRNACSVEQPKWYPWAPEVEHLWVRPRPPEGITHIPLAPTAPDERLSIPELNALINPPSRGNVGVVLGIRAAEAPNRRRSVSTRLYDNWMVPSLVPGYRNHVKLYPVYDWNLSDVWLAIRSQGWDYNEAYDLMAMAGVPPQHQRCAPPFGEEPIQNLWMFSLCFPEIWDRMLDRVPGAATAARYSRSELYAFKSLAEKPDGMPWRDFVRSAIEQHPQEHQPRVASRLGTFVRWHYRRTADPIAPSVPHPVSGVCWKGLYHMAVHGDYKHRRAAAVPGNEKRWPAYRAEIEALRAAGRMDEVAT
jgi:predicted phosphoadenosine phosphosulfate sulfurtransferase